VNAYTANVEAMGYGHPAEEEEQLRVALEAADLGDTVQWTVMADEARGMLLVQLQLEGINAVDVHEVAMGVWQDAWDEAFSEHAPTEVLGVQCVPVPVGAAT
jgi:hypothetical protein